MGVHDLSVQLALAFGGDLKTKEELPDNDEPERPENADDGLGHSKPKRVLTRRVTRINHSTCEFFQFPETVGFWL